MRRWWLVIALLLSLGLNLGILAAVAARRAGGPPRPKPPAEITNPGADPMPRLPRLADRLGLEGEERRKFIDIQWSLFQETSRLRLQLGEIHREVRRETTSETPDRAKIERLLNESSGVYLNLEKTLVKHVLATRDLLGPDKEREYLDLVGRLRVPNGPGPGMGLQGQEPRRPRQDGQEPFPGRFEDGRPRRDGRFRGGPGGRFGEGPPPREGEGPPPRFEEGGPEDFGGPPPEGEGPPPPTSLSSPPTP
jgi:hypothetical protein